VRVIKKHTANNSAYILGHTTTTTHLQELHAYAPEVCLLIGINLHRPSEDQTEQGRVKFTLEQATKDHTWFRGVHSTLSLTSNLDECGLLTPRPGFFTRENDSVRIV
jgi:hypothetical protein